MLGTGRTAIECALKTALHRFAKEAGSSGGGDEGAMTSLHLRVLDHPFDLNYDRDLLSVASASSLGHGREFR